MKTKEPGSPKRFIVATVLLMLLSVSLMLAVGLASNFDSPRPQRPAQQTLTHPTRTSQGVNLRALRGHVARWVAYFARSG
jgi:hypothetical protein